MKVYYFCTGHINDIIHSVGSLSLETIRKLANGKQILSCDIAEFNGHFLSIY